MKELTEDEKDGIRYSFNKFIVEPQKNPNKDMSMYSFGNELVKLMKEYNIKTITPSNMDAIMDSEKEEVNYFTFEQKE